MSALKVKEFIFDAVDQSGFRIVWMSAGFHILKIISNPLHTPKVAADNYPKEKECMCVYIF